MKFKIGDIVRLKSGSPKLTIARIKKTEEDNFYTCYWFKEDEKEFDSFVFPEEALKKEDSNDSQGNQ